MTPTTGLYPHHGGQVLQSGSYPQWESPEPITPFPHAFRFPAVMNNEDQTLSSVPMARSMTPYHQLSAGHDDISKRDWSRPSSEVVSGVHQRQRSFSDSSIPTVMFQMDQAMTSRYGTSSNETLSGYGGQAQHVVETANLRPPVGNVAPPVENFEGRYKLPWTFGAQTFSTGPSNKLDSSLQANQLWTTPPDKTGLEPGHHSVKDDGTTPHDFGEQKSTSRSESSESQYDWDGEYMGSAD